MLKGWLAGSALAVSTVVMAARTSLLSGTVLDDVDAAAAGVAVYVYCLEHPNEVFESATDDAGTFRVAVTHDGRYRVRLRDTVDVGCAAVDVSGGQSTRCLLRIVRPRAAITGTVRQRGAPQEHIIIVAFRPDELDRDDPTPDQVAETDREGKFKLDKLRRDEPYVLHAVVRGRPWPLDLVVTPPFNGAEIVLPDPAILAGRVVGPTGDPLTTPFTVACKDADAEDDVDDLALEKTFRSRDGTFRLDDFRPGDWSCRVTAHGFAPFHFDVSLSESEVKDDVSVRLRSGAVLTGTIKTDTGELVAGVVSLAGGGRSTPLSTTADAHGRFAIPDLDADRYVLYVRHPNYADARLDIDVHRPTTTTEVTLSAGRSVSGSILTGASQAPAGGAQVWLTADGDELDDPRATKADREGRFGFPHVRPGRYILRGALASASAVMDLAVAKEDLAGVTLQLKARQVQGRVYGLRPGETASMAGYAPGFSTAAKTTGSGEFALEGVPPGRLSISATRLNAVTRSAVEKKVETVVPEDGNAPFLEVRFDDGCPMSGRLTRASAPVAGVRVVLLSQRTGNSVSAVSNSAGEFSFEAVEEGEHELSVLDRRGSAPIRRAVRACSSKPLDVALPVMRLAGQVKEKELDEAIQNATAELIVSDDNTITSSQVVTNGSGQFTFGDLEPKKRYTLVVRKAGFQTKEIDVDAKAVPQDLVVRLERGQGLWLRLSDVTMRTPLRSVLVRALSLDGRETFMGGVSTDEAGMASIPLAPGRYFLRLHASGYAPILLRDVAVPRAVLAVAFNVGGSVQIRIGTERIPVRATIANGSGGDEVPLAFEDPSGELWLRQPLTTIEHLAPGRYKLILDEVGASPHEFEVRIGERTVVDVP